MRGVSGVSKGGTTTGGRGVAARSGSGGRFAVGGPDGAAASGAAAAEGGGAAVPVAAVGFSLLAAQESGDRGAAGRDAAARRRASSVLDELQGLQAELLGGRPDPARLARLAALGEGEEGADEGLKEAVRAVALRARIELARRTADPCADRTAAVR